jgi:hypothetical protein
MATLTSSRVHVSPACRQCAHEVNGASAPTCGAHRCFRNLQYEQVFHPFGRTPGMSVLRSGGEGGGEEDMVLVGGKWKGERGKGDKEIVASTSQIINPNALWKSHTFSRTPSADHNHGPLTDGARPSRSLNPQRIGHGTTSQKSEQ